MRVSLQPAYVIHSRPYRDTSVIVEVFTAQYGRVSLVGKGARRSRRGGSGLLLQPFSPLLVSYSGRSEMKTLTAHEAAGPAPNLRRERMFSGLYANELLMRLLHRDDPHPILFSTYSALLSALAADVAVDEPLRRFELSVLDELGYGFDLAVDAQTGEAVQPGIDYDYFPDVGLRARVSLPGAAPVAGFPGKDLLRMAAGELDGEVRLTAKRLLRQALAAHLGDAPLHSRALFRGARQSVTSGGPDGPPRIDRAGEAGAGGPVDQPVPREGERS
tara:strand:- start:150558 stop:151379 length:822 start_codon:yes stop_codon:yes gene_type:complete